jgi:hypothetical protein
MSVMIHQITAWTRGGQLNHNSPSHFVIGPQKVKSQKSLSLSFSFFFSSHRLRQVSQ